jgi:predicted site-specific integrase-resolvase
MGEDKVISQAEAARMLGLSRARVTQLIDAGVLPYVERTVTERAVRELDVIHLMEQERRPGRPRKSPEGASDAK